MRSIRVPIRQRTSQGIVPIAAAISRTSIDLTALRPEDDDLVAGRAWHVGDVDGDHVHRDRADDRRAPPAHEHVTAPGKAQIEPIGVAGWHDRDRRAVSAVYLRAVADRFARPQALGRHDTADEPHRRPQRSVVASGGGATP